LYSTSTLNSTPEQEDTAMEDQAEEEEEEEEVHEPTPEPVVPPMFPLKKVQAQVPAKKAPPKRSPIFEKKEPGKVSKCTAAKNKKQS
jgi:hypothetical protein